MVQVLILSLLLFVLTRTIAQECLRASNGNSPLPSFIRPDDRENRLSPNPIQAIISSYQFNCCGVITEWRAHVERSGGAQVNAYTISFQVWRPNSPSPIDTDGCYTLHGANLFSPISLANRIVTGVPPESERIEIQPGDVVGFYLESSREDDDGILFDDGREDESVWYTTGEFRGGVLTCPFPVGPDRTLDNFANLAPLITATVSITGCPSSTPVMVVPTTTIPTPSIDATSVSVLPPLSTPPLANTQLSPTLIVTPTQPSVGINLGLYVGVSAGLLVLVLLTVTLVGLGLLTRRRNLKKKQRDVCLVDAKNESTHASIMPYENTEPSTETNLAYKELTKSTISDYDYPTNPLAVTSDPSTTILGTHAAFGGVTREEEGDYTYIESDNKDKEIKQCDCEETKEPSYDPVVYQNPAYGDIVKSPDDEYYYINEGLNNKETKSDYIDGDKQLQSDPVVDQNAVYGAVEGVGFTTDPPIPTRENQAYLSVNNDSQLMDTYDYVRH